MGNTAFDQLIKELNDKPWLSVDFKEVKKLIHKYRREDRRQRKIEIIKSFNNGYRDGFKDTGATGSDYYSNNYPKI